MRIAAWMFVVCAVVTALGVFMPIVIAEGHLVSKHEQLSLYRAGEQRELVRRLLGAYRHADHVGHLQKGVGKILSHAHGGIKEHLSDASDAMDVLSGISDEDARRAGTALVILCWTIVGLAILMVVTVVLDAINGTFKRWHLVVALILALVEAALCVGVRIGMGLAVFEANDEIGANVVAVGSAATVLPLAAIGAFLMAIAMLVFHARRKRA